MNPQKTENEEASMLRQCDKQLLDACGDLDVGGVLSAIEAGADVNVEDEGCTPLYNAILSYGPPDDDDEDDDDEDGGPRFSDQEVHALLEETDRQRIQVAEILLVHGAVINKIPKGHSELLWYAVHSTPCLTEFLLKNGADPNLASDDHAEGFVDTPLSHAWVDESVYRNDEIARADFARIQRLLLSYGARPNTDKSIKETQVDLKQIRDFNDIPPEAFPQEIDDATPLSETGRSLFNACAALDVACVSKLLKEKYDPNVRDYDNGGVTPLCMVTEMQSNGFLELRDPDHTPEAEEQADLNQRAYDIARVLLGHGADPNIPKIETELDDCGDETIYCRTPLMFAACLCKDVEMARILLEYGANPNFRSKLKDEDGDTVQSLNGVDYHSDDPQKVNAIGMLLNEYGGCYTGIFDDWEWSLRDVDQALIYSCQRLSYYGVQLAAKLGADLSTHSRLGDRCLPVVAIYDAPQLLGKKARLNNWGAVESLVTDFALFLLVGMHVPISEKDVDEILLACVSEGYEELLETLLTHHSLGKRFRERAVLCKQEGHIWMKWPEEKRERLARLLGIIGGATWTTTEKGECHHDV